MFRRLRNSIMLFNTLTVSLVMLAAFAVIYLVTRGSIENENQQRLRAVSSMFFAPNRAASGISPDHDAPTERFSVEYGVSFVLFVRDGRLENVNSQLNLDDAVYIEAFEKTGGASGGGAVLAGRKWIFAVADAPPRNDRFTDVPGSPEYTRIAFLDVTNGADILRTLVITLTFVSLAVLLALCLISYRFAVRSVGPIEENYNKQKRFIADASHELRTPLAVIGANIDAVTASGGETVDSQREWFDYIRAELKRTGKLVDDLLYLAKSENIAGEASAPFDLSSVCETVCASIEAMLYDGGSRLKTDILPNITAVADKEKITQVLYILLDNAGKYTPPGGDITVRLARENDRAVLRVTNEGEDIAADALPKIFDRFYRADSSRERETGGAGLGLSIAKVIVENSGGSITAESGGGMTTFTVRLRAQRG